MSNEGNLKKVRRPGRAVFFEEQDENGQPATIGQPKIDPTITQPSRDSESNTTSMCGVDPACRARLGSLLKVMKAFKAGDFTVRMPERLPGVLGEIATELNAVIGINEALANEMIRMNQIVGTEGRLTERASIEAVEGMWATSIESVNELMNNLVYPTAEVGQVITAVAEGDLSRKMRLEIGSNPLKGEFQRIGIRVNTMVDQLNGFASEVTRVAREVGTEGALSGQALVSGVAGIWKDLTDSVNSMALNLTVQVRNIAEVTTAVAEGDLSKKITVEARGEILDLKRTINTMVDQLNAFASEVTRVAREVGTEGKLGGQAVVSGVAGTWKDLTDNVNMMASNLTDQMRNIAKVTTAVANGDLSQKITVDVQGEILDLKRTINTMVDQLNAFASEVTRVAREVGTEGKLGGQAVVSGVAGTWKDLTDNVNMMAANLTDQMRNIAKVTTAVANGDLSQKITVVVQGEILDLKKTINTMVDQLNAFASEVTRVAREVGTEGKLGGQAVVSGVAGTWKDLTDNVNMMASNLTDQVRNIAKVTTAVATGDLSQKITVEARGEILELKNTVNWMVDNLGMIIGDINGVMAQVGAGILTRTVEMDAKGEFASMVDGINATVESLRGIVTELTEAGINIGMVSQNMLSAGQEMNAMVSQLSLSVEQIAEGARAQAQQISAATRESEGVGKTASNTLTRSESMNQTAEGALRSVGEGSRAMDETIRNTELMLEGSKESVNSIESLSRSTEQIQDIVDVIRDIATQTNILAINAAIEAVRAGRQGKGFAVVAEEVKTLSADSKAQAKKISNLVQSVQKETGETVTTIKTMADNVDTGRRSIEQMNKALEDINQAIGMTSTTAKEISVATADQKRSIDSISESLDKISGIAADTSSVSVQSADSAKRLLAKMQELTSIATTLAGMSEKFQQTVGRFDVTENIGAKTGKAVVRARTGATAGRHVRGSDR